MKELWEMDLDELRLQKIIAMAEIKRISSFKEDEINLGDYRMIKKDKAIEMYNNFVKKVEKLIEEKINAQF